MTTKILESNISHTESKNEDGLRNRVVGNMAAGKGHGIFGQFKHS